MNIKKRIFTLAIAFMLLLGALPVQAGVIAEPVSLPFEDAQSGWFVTAVGFCYANGIMSGKSDTVFDPRGVTTREQMMTVLVMLDGEEIGNAPMCDFTDVRADLWYTPYVNTAVANGYTSGISDTLFGIGKTLTRQETVTLIYNFAVAKELYSSSSGDLGIFNDTEQVADWAYDAFGWAVGEGIIAGSNGCLNPRNSITRAELAQVIRTFMENVVFSDCEHSFEGLECSEICVCSLCGMKKGWPTGHSCAVYTCTEASDCEICGVKVAPKGHSFTAADCTTPMTCSICNEASGEALGHTTETDICKRCGKEFFESSYDKFVYCMNEIGMRDPSDPNTKYLMANISYANGASSTQYVKYNRSLDRTVFEIIYKFPNSNHRVRTTVTMDFTPGSAYHVESYYSTTDNLLYFPYYGSGRIFAADSSFVLEGYSGDQEYKQQFEEITAAVLLLNLDASNTLIKEFIGMSMADFGFSAFN